MIMPHIVLWFNTVLITFNVKFMSLDPLGAMRIERKVRVFAILTLLGSRVGGI